MRVALLTTQLSRRSAGLAFAIPPLVEALDNRSDVEMHVVGTRDSAYPADAHTWGRTVSVVSSPRFGLPWSREMANALVEIGPDVIDVQGLWQAPSAVSALSRRIRDIPVIVTPHGMLDPWALAQSPLRKKLALGTYEGRNMRRAHCIRALCESEARSVNRLLPDKNVAVIPNGIHLPKEERSETHAQRIRKILFLGRLDPKKGIAELLDAWSQAQSLAREKGWKLVIHGLGDDGYSDFVHQRVAQPDMDPDLVSVRGAVFGEEKAKVFREADAFVLPSYSEGLPMAVLEALSHGLPCLLTPECNIPEALACGAAMHIGQQPHLIRDGLSRIMNAEPADLAKMRLAAKDLAERKYTVDLAANSCAQLYSWAAGGAEPGHLLYERRSR